MFAATFVFNYYLTFIKVAFLHKNMLEYLTLAYANHFSVEISPDMIFYTILCEIANTIKKNPEKYRHLFTSSSNKSTIITLTVPCINNINCIIIWVLIFIIIMQHDVTKLDLNQVVEGIIAATPSNIGKLFNITFSRYNIIIILYFYNINI